MADIRAIYAVGVSLVRWLQYAYDEWTGLGLSEKSSCTFQLASSHDLIGTPTFKPGVVLYLFRVAQNEHARARARSSGPGEACLALDLHYLLFPWTETACDEATLLAWTMARLERAPVLGCGDLLDGGFAHDEAVQIVPGELSTEDLMRIWDAIDPPYRLSVPYVARVVRIDPKPLPEARRVVAQKLRYEPIEPRDPATVEAG